MASAQTTPPRPVVMPKVVLFYVFAPLADPEAVRLWQTELCERFSLTGRIIVSAHGINGTVAGAMKDVKQYVRRTKAYAPFRNADIKWSDGTGADFPRLSVKVRDELVTFGAPGELVVDGTGVVGGGRHLSPAALHTLVDERGDEVTFFDGRNSLEAELGRFTGAVVPDVSATREFAAELDSGKYDHLKEKPVVTYCTGGIRCEVLSAMMRKRGFQEVYQLEGGIARYGQEFGDAGLWEGSLYVFDNRRTVTFSADAAVIGRCRVCDAATSDLLDCAEPGCTALDVVCAACQADSDLCVTHRSIASATA